MELCTTLYENNYFMDKEDSMTEIEYNESRIRELRIENERLRKKAENEKAAAQIHDAYESLLNAGFSKEEAWELFLVACKAAWGAI